MNIGGKMCVHDKDLITGATVAATVATIVTGAGAVGGIVRVAGGVAATGLTTSTALGNEDDASKTGK